MMQDGTLVDCINKKGMTKKEHIRLTRTINGSPRHNPDSVFESSAVKPIV